VWAGVFRELQHIAVGEAFQHTTMGEPKFRVKVARTELEQAWAQDKKKKAMQRVEVLEQQCADADNKVRFEMQKRLAELNFTTE
jgi:hypothetical protein